MRLSPLLGGSGEGADNVSFSIAVIEQSQSNRDSYFPLLNVHPKNLHSGTFSEASSLDKPEGNHLRGVQTVERKTKICIFSQYIYLARVTHMLMHFLVSRFNVSNNRLRRVTHTRRKLLPSQSRELLLRVEILMDASLAQSTKDTYKGLANVPKCLTNSRVHSSDPSRTSCIACASRCLFAPNAEVSENDCSIR